MLPNTRLLKFIFAARYITCLRWRAVVLVFGKLVMSNSVASDIPFRSEKFSVNRLMRELVLRGLQKRVDGRKFRVEARRNTAKLALS